VTSVERQALSYSPNWVAMRWQCSRISGAQEARLLEQREVDVGLHVALGPRIAVPVPGAAEITALFNDADIVDAGLL
jgi:hypothetical protein